MKYIFNTTICFLIWHIGFSQQSYTISGYVKDKNTGEVLIGASVYDKESLKGTITNGYGFYSISLPAGHYTINYSFLGYETAYFEIKLNKNTSKDIFIQDVSLSIGAITITAKNEIKPLVKNEFSIEKYSIKNIRQMPSMFGEADAIKAIQLQSGVKTLGDGSSGMFIRGGSSDQNLILIDEAPIYNPSHLFGLISVFNPDALNHIELHKSNMPAQYGGRVSSVIDCKMKEGNVYDYDFSVGISPLSSIFTINGPVVKEKSSFFVSGRKSFIDILFDPGANMSIVPAFYDINLKLNTKLGSKDHLFVSVYKGNDVIESAEGFYNKWGNTSGMLRWNRNLWGRLFMNTSFITSNYKNYLEFNDNNRDYKWLTGIKDLNLKIDLSYYIRPKNVVKAGVSSIYHQFIPGETSDTLQSISRIQAFEHALYLLNDNEFFTWLGMNYGVRFSAFQNYGQATWYRFNEQYLPSETCTNKNGIYKTYVFVEPRLNVNLKLSPNYSIKLAYARNVQYMQVLQNNSLSYSSLEAWFPANPNIKPIVVDVVSAGWFQNLSEQYFLSLEMYYKAYQNQIDFVDHASLVNNPYIVGETREGTARSYGIELNMKKEIGRITGNVSYTFSRAFRTINGINNDKEYSSPYDIPHDFRVSAGYKLNTRWNIGATWMYMSGRPITLPIGFYNYQDNIVPIYTNRNSSRLPDYHRLDIACNYEPESRSGKINWLINFGVFNLYGRKNPLAYEFDQDSSSGEIKVYQYTLFTILPNFSLKVEF